MDENVKLGKYLCLILRHEPEAIGIQIDPFGWALINELIDGMNRAGKNIDRTKLDEIVATDPKNRYSYNDEKTKIRANNGHSLSVDVHAAPAVPPDILYHGTALRFVESIRRRGLMKQCRNHVHLAADYGTAVNVGTRHGKAVVLKINTLEMHNDGIKFYSSENGLWLTDNIPVKYIQF